jgi:hypothetical protein
LKTFTCPIIFWSLFPADLQRIALINIIKNQSSKISESILLQDQILRHKIYQNFKQKILQIVMSDVQRSVFQIIQ